MTDDEKRRCLKEAGWLRSNRTTQADKHNSQVHTERWEEPWSGYGPSKFRRRFSFATAWRRYTSRTTGRESADTQGQTSD